jgi:hypothetical protein
MENNNQIKPAPDDDWQRRTLSDAEAHNLAEDFLDAAGVDVCTDEADALVRMAIKIIDMFVYENNADVRDSNRNFLTLALYTLTADCAFKMDEFAKGVKA